MLINLKSAIIVIASANHIATTVVTVILFYAISAWGRGVGRVLSAKARENFCALHVTETAIAEPETAILICRSHAEIAEVRDMFRAYAV